MNILVLQHVASEHPGSFRQVMHAHGHTMHQIELDEGETIPPFDGFDIMLVMGGPMDVWETEKHPWLVTEIAAIKAWVTTGRPYLGMCLGHQLLGLAMGGEVGLMPAADVGITRISLPPDPLFAGIPERCPCFQWHGAQVTKLPPGARLLAGSPQCAVEAFAIGTHAYGLQFHMELTETTAAEWGALPEYAAALERVKGPGALPRIEADVAENFAALQSAAHRIFENFLTLAAAALRQPTFQQSTFQQNALEQTT